ncbi:B3 domain-containing protein Os06g0194400-like [Rosa rugosa]|uniref:B3 domain-containing protein Os06g0194400-like n=1 Tax=Rosa rugosa TaxID=74645 RepID=UPI002B40DC7F|nr:B3 domain-containing protein Os06g0194400-like [Rosa rugosa]XP_062024096.1 B3 domain-containing protein Os06g0194400-like [Rosa rugosa]
MAKPKTSYEETRKQRMEENRKRMEALNLPQLAQAFRTSSSPKPSPMKRQKPRKVEKQIVEVRRSARVARQPTPVYREVEVKVPRSYGRISKHRDLSNRVYASEYARAEATEKAEELESRLGSDYPTFVKPMLQSHVTGGFWLGLPLPFCRKYLPKRDAAVMLVDEEGEEYPIVYLGNKNGLSGGWRGFSIAHELVDGDALVFQLIKPTTFKVYIIRVESS